MMRLRAATAEQHRKLEAGLDLLRPDLTLDGYIALLQSFYSFYASWEKQAQSIAPEFYLPVVLERSKTPLIEHDLKHLSAKLPPKEQHATSFDLPDLVTFPQLLGSMYVVEGSTLGGQLLSRHFLQALGLTPEAGCSFFSSHGRDVGSMWKRFRDDLTSHATPQNDDLILSSAAATFDRLYEWLCVGQPSADSRSNREEARRV